jgi:hypothetical protein
LLTPSIRPLPKLCLRSGQMVVKFDEALIGALLGVLLLRRHRSSKSLGPASFPPYGMLGSSV